MPHVTVQNTCTYSSITNKRQDQFFIENVYSRPRNFTKGRGDIISVYTGSGDGATRCFDAKSAGLKRTFKGHENTVNSVQVTRLPYVSMCIDMGMPPDVICVVYYYKERRYIEEH